MLFLPSRKMERKIFEISKRSKSKQSDKSSKPIAPKSKNRRAKSNNAEESPEDVKPTVVELASSSWIASCESLNSVDGRSVILF